jgi:hypothetical protein
MMRRNLLLGGLCLLALGWAGMGSLGLPAGAAVVADQEAQAVWGGDYCPTSSQCTAGNICNSNCPESICTVTFDMGANYDLKDNDCAGTNCGSCYAMCN